jgi:AcrR family transcriptional regulator
MVQKYMANVSSPTGPLPKRRGRPRAYDPKQALRSITEAFWKSGYSGTSLDDLSKAAGMNRPSLYAAFGDKRELYLAALGRYWENGHRLMRELLSDGQPLRTQLLNVYEGALHMYFPDKARARGCFAIGTATVEAVQDPKIRVALANGVRKLDEIYEARLRMAQERGELSAKQDAATLASLASATLHTIAIRARAGVEREELRQFARRAVDAICRD